MVAVIVISKLRTNFIREAPIKSYLSSRYNFFFSCFKPENGTITLFSLQPRPADLPPAPPLDTICSYSTKQRLKITRSLPPHDNREPEQLSERKSKN
ncbi:hypothetical protein NPIL_291971 [Nephila pilipes]|uniref:Uncharacterized protein n=1 Tax=Nephila pilipes TaxID=299642 RepID=A0A8X6TE54_NEPPI|nr:hypothetical protein NPIL_291971 [Nephila pilipes]